MPLLLVQSNFYFHIRVEITMSGSGRLPDVPSPSHRLIVGVTGATGVIFAVRLLEKLRDAGRERHLVLSKWAVRTLLHETSYSVDEVQRLATET